LQVQGGLKEGILLWAMPAPSQTWTNSQTSPQKPPLNLSYSQIIKTSSNLQACDPGKGQVIRSPDRSCGPSVSQTSYNQIARDPGKPLGDLPRDWLSIWSLGHVNFRSVTCPLINMWKTMGIINRNKEVNKVTRLTVAQSIAVILSCFDHPYIINPLALKGSLSVTCIRACPNAAHRPPCISI
jgi:hypothetical protein